MQCFLETAISVVGVLLVLGSDAVKLVQQYADGIKKIEGGKDIGAMTPAQKHAYDEAVDALWQTIKASIPFWKILAIIFIEACTFHCHVLEVYLFLIVLLSDVGSFPSHVL
jgi:hypothetical protein